MIRHPVLKDLAGANKTHKFGPIALETRQGAILAGTFVGYSLISYYLAGWLGLSTNGAALAFSWVLPLAVIFAFFKKDGRHLDWWLEKKWLSATRPKVLFFKRRDPAQPEKPVRDSIQEALPAERFYWEMLRCKDGTYLVAFEVTPVALSLVGDTQRGRVYAAATELYNRIDFPVVEMTRSKEGSTARYTRRLKDTMYESIDPGEDQLSWYSEQLVSFLEWAVSSHSIFERRSYVVLPYNPAEEDSVQGTFSLSALAGDLRVALGFGRGKKRSPSKKDAKRRQLEAEQAYAVLRGRAQVLYDGFVSMGCRIRALTDSELLDFLKGQTSSYDEDSEDRANPFEPVSLESGGYEMLPENERQRMIEAAESLREEAPPALGIGDLSVSDKVAPDAVRVYPDYLRVEDRFHTTLFVNEWADEVIFGMLEGLTHIDGRVKVVKYINPRPKDEALVILGSRLAQLRASARTADDGDVRSSQQREISMFTNEQAMAELTADRQKYLELSFMVHCEADSEEELEGLVRQVRTTLATYRTETKLAREEAWEGFLSCLPLGKNHLSHRYVSKGMLTNPLACLFSFSTHQINHETGIYLGKDQRSGAVITLDNRRLTNPHSVIIGQSGGGKTFVLKCLATRYRMLGHRVMLVDPVGNSNYAPVVKRVNGAFAMIGPGSPHKINPFDLHDDYVNISLLEDILDDDEDDPEEARHRARAAALDGKVQEITRMVSLMITSESSAAAGTAGGLTGGEAGYVEKAVYETYRRKGITRDPETHKEEPPTLADFFVVLGEHAGENGEVASLMEKLYSWHSGALSTMFDSQTNVDLQNKFLVFQISRVKNQHKAPVMHAILEFMNGILSNPAEPSDCIVDESWSILAYRMSAEFCETMTRSGRALDNAMCFASQNPVEFVGSPQGQVILDLAATHMIFRHEHQKAAEATASIYDLAEEETRSLLNLHPGQGYLIIDQNRIRLQVLGSRYEEALFNTDPKKRSWAKEFLAEYETAHARPTKKDRQIRDELVEEEVLQPPEDDLEKSPEEPPQTGSPQTGSQEAATTQQETSPPRDGNEPWKPYRTVADGDDTGDRIPGEEEEYTPAGDPGTSFGGDGAADAADYGDAYGDALPVLPGADEPMRVYAFCGDEPQAATDAAAAVARLVSREARRAGLYVVAVDAAGGGLAAALAGEEALPPDDYLVGGPPQIEELAPHIGSSRLSDALKVVPAPENGHLPAHRLIEALGRVFDVCICACSDSSYATDWLLEADRVAGCSSEGTPKALSAALAAEDKKGANGTVLAVDASGGQSPLDSHAAGRPVFTVGETSYRVPAGRDVTGLARALIEGPESAEYHEEPKKRPARARKRRKK